MVASEYGRKITFIPPASYKTFWDGFGALWRNFCFIAPGASNSKFPRGSEALLGPSWGPLEGLVEASWGPLGALLGFSEAQVVPNALKAHFGDRLGAFGGPRTPPKGDIFLAFFSRILLQQATSRFVIEF